MQPYPPPNFVPTESKIPGIKVFMPAPAEAAAEQAEVEFKCPQCGAAMAYSVDENGLSCAHCGYREATAAKVIGRRAEKSEFSIENLERATHGWGEARKELECQSCGARITLPAESIATTCAFCGSNKVVQSAANQEQLRPRFLIPFAVDEAKCQGTVHTWLGSSWMTPSAVGQLSDLGAFTAIYLPFWAFQATTLANWKAEVGHTVSEHYYDAGSKEWKTRTRIDWRWESGQVRLKIEDLLVTGTGRVSNLHLGKIRTYDLAALVEYDPKYLAGFQAQAYDRPLEQAWEIGRQEMRERTRAAGISQASTSMVRNFSMNLDFNDESWRYLLLPVYLAAYRYEEKAYQVLVNGQNGAISGQRPVDWNKVWLVLALILSPGVLLTLLGGLAGLVTLPVGGGGFLIAVFGFVLLVIGLALTYMIVTKANQEGAA